MNDTLTNLLPPERRHSLRRAYFLRLATVAAALATLLVGIALVLLIPTLLLLESIEKGERERLASVEAALASADETAFSARLTMLADSAATLLSRAESRTASETLRELLLISRPGISLADIAYAPPEKGKEVSILRVTGTAATRDALRSYQLALQGASFARSAELPVSAYARDSEIPFTITVSLAP